MNPTFNPYAPPTEAVFTEPHAAIARQSALYTPGHVALATFFGSPLAGAVILALNERRLGRGSGAPTVIYGILATAALLGISFAVPLPLGLAALFVMRAIAQKQQGAAIAEHLAAGGRKASGWAAVGIGLLCLVAVAIPLVIVLVVIGDA